MVPVAQCGTANEGVFFFFLLHTTNPMKWRIGQKWNMFQSLFLPICPSLSPSLRVQDDAGQLLGAQGPGNLSERGRRLLSGLGCVRVHRFAGKTPGPLPLQLLPHQLPTSLRAQVGRGQSGINAAANSLLVPVSGAWITVLYLFFICWSRLCFAQFHVKILDFCCISYLSVDEQSI